MTVVRTCGRHSHRAQRGAFKLVNPQILSDLIVLLKKTKEASRPLDDAIDACVGKMPPDYGGGSWHRLAPCSYARPASIAGGIETYFSPHFTSSIDAASALIPAGCIWQILHAPAGPRGSVWCVRDNGGDFDVWADSDVCATPALAICVAGLRAQLQLIDGGGPVRSASAA